MIEDNDVQTFAHDLNDFMRVTNRSIMDVASDLRVSIPTVERWTIGKSAPHPAMRVPIRAYFQRKIAEKNDAPPQDS